MNGKEYRGKSIAVRKTKGMEMSMPIFIYSVLYDETG